MVDLTRFLAVPQGGAQPSPGLPGYPQSLLLHDAHARWLAARLAAEMPSWSDLRPHIPDSLRAHAILFEVQPEPLDFRYLEIGSHLLAISNADHTGRLMSELAHQRPPSKIWDHFTAACDARAPIKSVLPYVGRNRDIGSVYHIVLPLADDGEIIDRLLVCVDSAPVIRLADGTQPFTQLG
ncbi:MAG TPA: hypothetical protein VF342_05430 [Alphaproteobacteria bacterium]